MPEVSKTPWHELARGVTPGDEGAHQHDDPYLIMGTKESSPSAVAALMQHLASEGWLVYEDPDPLGGVSFYRTTTSYYANGQRIALAVNSVVSYLASDGLGSALVALNASGNATASLLYAPCGGTRYGNGTMPTDYGFTGQHADAATGLDYYNARYYDPVAGQFERGQHPSGQGL